MKLVISPRAKKQLKKISKVNQIIIAKRIRQLTTTFPNKKLLKGQKNVFRTRVGNYRIVYKKTKKEVYIILIAHRKEIYSLLNRLLK